MRLKEDQTEQLTKFILQNLDQYAVINPDPDQLCKLILILIEEDESSLQSNLVEYFEENTSKFCSLLLEELSHYQGKSQSGSPQKSIENEENEEIMENLTNSSDRNPLQRSDFSDDDEENNGRDSDNSEPIVAGHKRYVQREEDVTSKKKISRDHFEDNSNKRNLKKVQRGGKQEKEKGEQPGMMPGMMQQGPPLPAMFQMRPGQQQMMPQMPMPMQYWAPYQFNQMPPMFFPQPPFSYPNQDRQDKDNKRGGYQKKNFQKNQKKDLIPDEIPKNQLYIKYIPDHYNSAERLKNFYQKFGKIINIQTNWKEKIAIVEFKKIEEAQAALNQKELLFGLKQIMVTQNKTDLSKTHLQIIEERKQQEEKDKQAMIQKQKNQKPNIVQQNKQFHNESQQQQQQQDQSKSTPQQQQQQQSQQQQQQKVNPILKNKVEKFQAQRDKKISENRKNMILQKFTNQLKLVLFLKKRLVHNEQLFGELNDFYQQIQSKKEKLVKSMHAQTQEIESLIENEEKCKLFDFTLNIVNLPETATYNTLIEQFEEFGKINQFKMNSIQKTASLKYFTFECAEKAFLNTMNLTFEFADKNLSKYLVVSEPSRKESTQVNEEAKAN